MQLHTHNGGREVDTDPASATRAQVFLLLDLAVAVFVVGLIATVVALW